MGNINGEMSGSGIDYYKLCFSSLGVNKNPFWPANVKFKAPHKTILLLAVIAHIESGVITENKIVKNPVLLGTYSNLWQVALPNIRIGVIDNPFKYLESDKFWHFDPTLKTENRDALQKNANKKMIAHLDEKLFLLLQIEDNRTIFKDVLISSGFDISTQDLLSKAYKSVVERLLLGLTVGMKNGNEMKTVDSNETHNNQNIHQTLTIPLMDKELTKKLEAIMIQINEADDPYNISLLGLDTRTYNALRRNDISTVEDLLSSWDHLPNFRNVGETMISSLRTILLNWVPPTASAATINIGKTQSHIIETSNFTSEPTPGQKLSEMETPLRLNDFDYFASFEEKLEFLTRHVHDPLLNRSIGELKLLQRVHNTIGRAGITLISELVLNWKSVNNIYQMRPAIFDNLKESIFLWKPGYFPKQIIILPPTPTVSLMSKKNQIEEYLLGMLEIPIAENILDQWTAIKDNQTFDKTKLTSLRKEIIYYFQIKSELGEEISYKDYLRLLFIDLNTEELDILVLRYGLFGQKNHTLVEVCSRYGVTRERIRQRESNSIGKLQTHFLKIGRSPIEEQIMAEIDRRNGIASIKQINELFSGFYNDTGYNPDALLNFISLKLFSEREQKGVHFSTYIAYIRDFGWVKTDTDLVQIKRTTEKINHNLSTNSSLDWNELYPLLIQQDGLLTLTEGFAHSILNCMFENGEVFRDNFGSWRLSSPSTRKETLIQKIHSVLLDIGQPAHYSEIAAVYNQKYPGAPQSDHNVHSKLGAGTSYDKKSPPIFVLVGRGKYAIPEWGFHNDGNVGNAVRRILNERRGPMTLAEITEEVHKTWDVQQSAIIAAIANDARFMKVGNFYYLTVVGDQIERRIKRDDSGKTDRIIRVLSGIGEPATLKQITEIHNRTFTLLDQQLTEPLVKGLLYRSTSEISRTSVDQFGLTKWNLPTYIEPFQSPLERVLELIKENEPIGAKALFDLYNQTYSENTIKNARFNQILSELGNKVSKPLRGIYQINQNFFSKEQ